MMPLVTNLSVHFLPFVRDVSQSVLMKSTKIPNQNISFVWLNLIVEIILHDIHTGTAEFSLILTGFYCGSLLYGLVYIRGTG